MVSQIKAKSTQKNSFIATGVMSFIDGYDSWVASDKCFQTYRDTGKFCPSTSPDRIDGDVVNGKCIRDLKIINMTNTAMVTMNSQYYYKYLDDFLNDPPSIDCPYGGRAQYKDGVKLTKNSKGETLLLKTSYFMGYHSVLQSSQDFVNAFEDAKLTSKFLENQVNKNQKDAKIEVFPYSIFYVFYDQLLTMWKDTILSLSLSLVAILLVTFILTGFDLRNTLITLFTLISILFNILNVMYWWNISLLILLIIIIINFNLIFSIL